MEKKLYLEDRVLIITDSLQDKNPLYHYDFTIIPVLISKIKKEDLPLVYLYHPNPSEALEDLKKYFDVIEGAGGIVINEKDEVLFIYRRGIWDLPKGKIEAGEKPENAAKREVQEECGLRELQLDNFFTNTYHIFKEGRRRKMKITHWFLMRASSDQPLTPQTFEGIEKVEWIPPEQISALKTYRSIQEIIKALKNDGSKPATSQN